MWPKIIKKYHNIIKVEFTFLNHFEKWISTIGGFLGILLVLLISEYFVGTRDSPLIVASMGASAVLLFAVPHGPLSQPWALVGGHLISAIIGITFLKWIPNIFIATALSVSLAIAAMYYLRCIHNPIYLIRPSPDSQQQSVASWSNPYLVLSQEDLDYALGQNKDKVWLRVKIVELQPLVLGKLLRNGLKMKFIEMKIHGGF